MPPSDKFQLLQHIIYALEKFQDHPDSQFNFSKLCKGLQLPPREGEELLDMVIRFQRLFQSNLSGYVLCKTRKNSILYLKLQKKVEGASLDAIETNEITINTEQVNLLSDIIYYFQHINIGKGFDLNHNGSELLQKVKNLKKVHPYFFEHRGNGLIYPTKLAVDLGMQILAYNRGNKPIRKVEFSNYSIIIQESRRNE